MFNARNTVAITFALATASIGLFVAAPAQGASAARAALVASLTEISCEVLEQDHTPDAIWKTDLALRDIVQSVSLSTLVTTPSSFGTSTDLQVLSLAKEANDRFRTPPDRILESAAALAAKVVANLAAGRTGPDVTEAAWFFGSIASRSVMEGSAFNVALGVCPGIAPGPGSVVTVTSSNEQVLANQAFSVKGDVLTVQTSPYPEAGTTGVTITIDVTTSSGLQSTSSFVVSVLHLSSPPPPAPAPAPTTPPEPAPAPTTPPAPIELAPAPTTPPAPIEPAPAPTTPPAPIEPAPAPTTPPAPAPAPTTPPAPIEPAPIELAPASPPPAPGKPSAKAGNRQVALSWLAPPPNDVAPVTDYVVEYSSNRGASWSTFADGSSSKTSTTVTGLTNGTTYIFRVAAINRAGTGAHSQSSDRVTPRARR